MGLLEDCGVGKRRADFCIGERLAESGVEERPDDSVVGERLGILLSFGDSVREDLVRDLSSGVSSRCLRFFEDLSLGFVAGVSCVDLFLRPLVVGRCIGDSDVEDSSLLVVGGEFSRSEVGDSSRTGGDCLCGLLGPSRGDSSTRSSG